MAKTILTGAQPIFYPTLKQIDFTPVVNVIPSLNKVYAIIHVKTGTYIYVAGDGYEKQISANRYQLKADTTSMLFNDSLTIIYEQ